MLGGIEVGEQGAARVQRTGERNRVLNAVYAIVTGGAPPLGWAPTNRPARGDPESYSTLHTCRGRVVHTCIRTNLART